MKFGTILTFVAGAMCFLLTGCDQDFDWSMAKSRAEGKAFQLDNEQVSLTPAQLSCGVENELWAGTSLDSGQQSIYQLTQKGNDLHFSGDIYANEPGYPAPFVQVRGKFNLQLLRVVTIGTASDGAKLVQTQLGVWITHPCFAAPLPMMGIRKGKFSPEVAPTLKYEFRDDGWYAAELVH